MFQDTISVVRRLDWGPRAKDVRFVVFDAPSLNLPFEERMEFLEKEFLTQMVHETHVRVHSHQKVQSLSHLMGLLQQYESQGAEGLMIRKPGSFYEAQRSHTLLKVKPFKDTEAVVIGHKPGKGRHKGVMGAIVLRMPSGVEFDLGTGFSGAQRRNPPAIGATVSYRYTELTKDGKPKCTGFICVRDYE
jgi:DNA ligase-1